MASAAGKGRGKSRARKAVDKARRKRPEDKSPAKTRGTKKRPGRLLAHGCAFTSEIQAAILGACAKGRPRKYAAAEVGIGERTLQRWVERGRDNLELVDAAEDADDGEGADDGEVVEVDKWGRFLQQLIQAEAMARGALIDRIYRHSSQDWRAGAWLLERVDARSFGSATKVEGIVRDEHGDEQPAGELLLEKLAEIAERAESHARRSAEVGDDDG